jgi:4-hydroxybenzoate polyprenyltransferase
MNSIGLKLNHRTEGRREIENPVSKILLNIFRPETFFLFAVAALPYIGVFDISLRYYMIFVILCFAGVVIRMVVLNRTIPVSFVFYLILAMLYLVEFAATEIHSSNNTLAMDFVIWFVALAALQGRNRKEIFGPYFYANLIFFALALFMYATGRAEDISMYTERGIRHTLGFGHPNIVGYVSFNLIVSMILYKGSKMNIIHYAIGLFITFYIHSQAISNTAFIISLAVLGLTLIYQVFRKKINRWKKIPWLLDYSPLLIVAFFLLVYNIPSLNVSVSSIYPTIGARISLVDRIVKANPLSLLGKSGSNLGLPFDNTYFYVLVFGGAIGFVIFLAYYLVLLKRLNYQRQYLLYLLILLILVYGMSESTMCMLMYNCTLLLLAAIPSNKQFDKECSRYCIRIRPRKHRKFNRLF